MKAKYYFESHITIEPVFGEQLEQIKEICKEFDFKVAELLMKKREDDTEERSKFDTFATGHGKDLDVIKYRTKTLAEKLISAGFKLWRYKIEDTLLDSRFEDTLNIMKDNNNAK